MGFKYAIFDMDGLMFDTERLYSKAFDGDIAKKWNITISEARRIELLGKSEAKVEERFHEWYGEDFDYYKFHEECKAYVRAQFKDGDTPVKPGLLELVEYLREKNIPMTVATSNDKSVTEYYLRQTHILDYFKGIVSGDMKLPSKPAPDIFLRAGEIMGVEDTTECAVFEDSENGLLAAHNANMAPIIVPDLVDPTIKYPGKAFAKLKTLDEAKKFF